MSETAESLTDVLRGSSALVPNDPQPAAAEPAPKVEAPKEVAAEPEKAQGETQDRPRDESGKFVKSEPEGAKPEGDKPDGKPVSREVAGIIDERRKRQQLEAKLREFQSQQPEQPKVSVLEDEDKAFGQRINAGTQDLRGKFFTQSVRLARLEHKDDYAAAESAFMDAAEADPRLWDSLRGSDDPGEYIYQIGSHLKELGPYGGNLAARDQAKFAELRTQLADKDQRLTALEKELAAFKASKAELDAVPRSLNKVASTAAPKVVSQDAEPLNKIARFGNS